MRTLRASEIGAYLYCQRAWWYSKSGVPSENQAELIAGSELHFRHGRAMMGIGCLRCLAFALTLLGLMALVSYLVTQFL